MGEAKRKSLDCRLTPSEKNCSVYISGTEDEVMTIAVRHAVAEHGHTDGPELRAMIQKGMMDEAPAP